MVRLASNLDFEYLCDLNDKDTIRKQQYNGLYLIEVCTKGRYKRLDSWIKKFVDTWDLPEFQKSYTSTTKKKRIEQHKILKEWMPVYLGKFSNVSSRLIEHIELPKEKSTYALKIEARKNIEHLKFRVSVVKLEVANYNFIAPFL